MDNNFVVRDGLRIENMPLGEITQDLVFIDSEGIVKALPTNTLFSATTITGYNKTNWDTAFGWGNHASAGYLTSLPAHTHNYLSLNGGTLTGDLIVKNGPHANIDILTTATNSGDATLFLGEADRTYGGYFRYDGIANTQALGSQSTGNASKVDAITWARGSSNITVGGSVTANSFIKSGGTSSQFLKADGSVDTNTYVFNQDNEVRKISIAASSLPVNYTKADVVAHLNTLGITKTEIETLVVDIVGGDETLTIGWSNVTGTPNTYPPSIHSHDDLYYTKTITNSHFSGGTAITGYNKSNWDTAFGWGNHASAGYLTAETDPKGVGSAAFSGTTTKTLTITRNDGTTTTASFSDTNTTYSAMSLSELNTGTATTGRVIGAKTLVDWGDVRYLGTSAHDSLVRKIDIASTSLPVDYTEADVVAHLNSVGFTKSDMETLIITVDGGGGMSTGGGSSYTHPLKVWVDKTTLSGATVISNLTVDEFGHPTDWATRTLSAANIGAEPTFTKLTGFNKNFGTAAGTVAEGNDSRILNGQTAFGWGNHASASYATTSSLSGYLPLAGGTMTGPLGIPSYGSTLASFAVGTGDAASYSSYNFKIQGHYGMGLVYGAATNAFYNFRTGTWDVKGGYNVNGVPVALNTHDHDATYLKLSGGTLTGVMYSSYSRTFNPASITKAVGGIHLTPTATTNDLVSSITFSGQPNLTTEAQAGIYVQGSGTYGTKMVLATSNNHSTGPVAGLSIDHLGNTVTRGTVTTSGGQAVVSPTGTNHVSGMWQGTQAEYDAIVTKVATTLYFIK